MRYLVVASILSSFLFFSCSEKDDGYTPTPVSLEIPQLFGQLLLPPTIPSDNPLTAEGIALGKKLFYDPILSADGTQACATCHDPQAAFSDTRKFSIGIDGIEGTRNSMPLFNLAWNSNQNFFWDGRANSLENQALEPVENPIEMHNTWGNATAELQATANYPELFSKAFGTDVITKSLVTKAIAQFEMTLISANSKFDKYLLGEATLTESESNGIAVFMDETRGDCFHCHGDPNSPLWTDNTFHNNGLDATITDLGLGGFSGDPREFGLFKSPSLRNLAYTAPYMHDGRFQTLDEVINHYSEGLVYSETIDPLMKKVSEGGVHLTEEDKADLKAFLLTLSEPGFRNNPDFQNPN
ncbi:cytochrome-c peroxidase [Ulvibacter litoralis]|uniref:Cytochrome c peroxidase n=1 Tax=Ulvibacter litoralis TaxID=227084 RepID=A0A1G7CY19_9FLAO|nr:cytochrome c peroxidase [Ulvibacter litoralis]GHC45646.1 cytochrome-c peroxidase [Ulvibacter litoralis]SDE44161.1 cytochrome c peroxidase [Ulvibacter litoralis]